MNTISVREFAVYAAEAIVKREESYNARKGYKLSYHDAIELVGTPEVWHWPIYMMISEGFCECSQWIEDHGGKEILQALQAKINGENQ